MSGWDSGGSDKLSISDRLTTLWRIILDFGGDNRMENKSAEHKNISLCSQKNEWWGCFFPHSSPYRRCSLMLYSVCLAALFKCEAIRCGWVFLLWVLKVLKAVHPHTHTHTDIVSLISLKRRSLLSVSSAERKACSEVTVCLSQTRLTGSVGCDS